jgi:hypothetical protein
MKTKSIILATIFAVCSISSHAQLKVDAGGRIGMGTLFPNPAYKCHIKGNLLLTTYPGSPSIDFKFKVGNGWPGTEIGTTVDKLAFWESYTGYNKLYAEQFYKFSDSTSKTEISPIESGLQKVLSLKTYRYALKDTEFSMDGKETPFIRYEYGFLSQEIEKTLDMVKITDDVKGAKLMDYDQIIPLAVAAIQEQQNLIDSLQRKISLLENRVNSSTTLGLNNIEPNNELNYCVLEQNVPNPFNESSIIKYEIRTEYFKSASIILFDLTGKMLKSYEIYEPGKGQIEIFGDEFGKGMYIYSLLLNNKEIDSKRMIISN